MFLVGACAFLVAVLLMGCGKKSAAGPGGGPPGGGPGGSGGPAPVSVLRIETVPVTLTRDLPGRTSAYRVAEVRARVSGIVLHRDFEEGSEVTEGQVLFMIDPAPYEASLDSARGTLAKAEANVATARSKKERYQQLVKDHAISRQDYDDAVANLGSYAADVLSGQAAVRTAEINLGYTKVQAPITGRIGISQVTEGAYVQDSAATLLATVQQLDQIYVDVTQASSDVLRLRREIASGQLLADRAGRAQVKLILEDGRVYAEEGSLEMSDVTVSASTNSVTVRALFPNPAQELLPGLFVRARLEEGESPRAILVPQSAVTRNMKGEPTALIIGAGEKAELRVLQTARAVGQQWLVTAGLKVGDRVILDNLQKVHPGSLVHVAPAAPSANQD